MLELISNLPLPIHCVRFSGCLKGLSVLRRKSYGAFLGEGVAAMPSSYPPTYHVQCSETMHGRDVYHLPFPGYTLKRPKIAWGRFRTPNALPSSAGRYLLSSTCNGRKRRAARSTVSACHVEPDNPWHIGLARHRTSNI